MAKKKQRKVKVNKGKIGNKVILGLVAVLVGIPVAVMAVSQQTNIYNHASGGEQGQPITNLNSAADITSTNNADDTMGPPTSQANYANQLPDNLKGQLQFTLYSGGQVTVYPSGIYPTKEKEDDHGNQPYVYPSKPYAVPSTAYNPPQTYTYPTHAYYPAPSATGCASPAVYVSPVHVYGASTKSNGNGNGNGNGNNGNGNNNGPQDITGLCLTISKVEVHVAYLGGPATTSQPTDKWETLAVANPTTLNLFNLNAPALLGLTKLAAGRYTQVRLYVTKATATLTNGQSVALLIPGHNNIVKVNKTFTIDVGNATTISLGLDPSHSVIKTGNSYVLKPVVANIVETH